MRPELFLGRNDVVENEHGQEEGHRDEKRSTIANERVLQRANHVEDLQKRAHDISNSTNKCHYCCPETNEIEEFGLFCHHSTCIVVLATSDICSGNWPVWHDGERRFATAVLTGRNIRWPKGQFHLPDSPFPMARNSMERPREPLPLALSERKSPSCKQKGAFWQ